MGFVYKKIELTGGSTWDSYQIPDQVRTVVMTAEGDTKFANSDAPSDYGMIWAKSSFDASEMSGLMGKTFYFNGTAGQFVYIVMYQNNA